MLANGQTLTIFATFFVATAYAVKNTLVSLDDISGFDYVDSSQVEEMRTEMLSRGNGYGSNWIVMPDGNGNPKIAILSLETEANDTKRSLDLVLAMRKPVNESVTLRLYTRDIRGEPFDDSSLDFLPLDASKPTKIIIHGWKSSEKSSTVTSIRDAYMSTSDANVITVDWSHLADETFYPASAYYTKIAGEYVGRIIDDLVEKKDARYGDIHLIGHSLGAHTAGVAGFSSKGEVGRITGLDPAKPCFQDLASEENSLTSGDAKFVDVIHTCAGALGMSTPIGHADFYPNGGTPFQPGCCCFSELTGTCSHGRSHQYFVESILSKKAFLARKCDSWKSFVRDACENSVVPMGDDTPVDITGIFYLETNSESPFGRGQTGTKWTD